MRPNSPVPACLPGDVIQYRGATFADGSWATHHTSIVETVDAGRPTGVLQQNWNGVRVVTRERIDLGGLTGGWARVFRPLARTPARGIYQFTVTNATLSRVRVVERTAGGAVAYALSPADTEASYQVRTWQSASVPVLWVGTSRMVVHDAAAYEVTAGGVAEV
jgi:hypothetical protein